MANLSALGNYIHLKWENYKKAGTYRVVSNWKRTGKEVKQSDYSDFNEQIFNRFKDSVLNRCLSLDKFTDEQKLKNFEKWYNENRKKAYDFIKTLSANKKQDFFEAIVKGALKISDRDNSLDKKVTAIASQLDFDDSSLNLKLKDAQKVFENGVVKINKLRGVKWSYVDTFFQGGSAQGNQGQARIPQLEQNINNLEDKDLKSILLNDLKVIKNFLEDIKNNIKGPINVPEGVALAMQKHNSNKDNTNNQISLTNLISISKNGNAIIKQPLTDFVYGELAVINGKLDFAKSLVKIQAAFTEAIAPFVEKVGEVTATNFSLDFLKNWVGNQKGVKIIGDVEKIAQKTIKLFDFKGDKDHFGFSSAIMIADGKVDAILGFEGEDVGLNIKNYNLSNDYYSFKGMKIPATVSIVTGTPLTSILFGAQAFENRIGTHFLNILTKHEDADKDAVYHRMRSAGTDALKLLILYNALTGDLGIKEQKNADIFMIENKATGKVSMFSINTLLKDSILNQEAFIVKDQKGAEVKNFMFNNNKNEVSAQKRIAKVLSDAHQAKLKASISVAYLKNKKGI